ncbi:type I DNA topoisomerase [Natranaerobius trueperi]|uniref:DNA topoisomerase 1 n=1 Tax=Natranaerobius trueperi TaxID=759412 RepID=A0A226BYY5_9FIRM|nr:type I DNA topoisomerase [Natranaerobius trueperi]OWZ84216.1 DNA topoisomerase I [Natranaerobius trueperi]
MAKNLVIVESPAKAQTIKRYLGKNYKVKASMGHLIDLPRSQMGIEIDEEFKPKYITIRGKGKTLAELKKEAKKAEKVYLAADPDREGEAICWHLRRALNVEDQENCRVIFNEITKEAVKSAFKEPREIAYDLVNAQQARRVLDRLVGYNISPILWKKVRKGLSAGRVQSVAVKLICDREKEIEKFEPEEYWSLIADLQKDGMDFEAKLQKIEGEKAKISSEENMNEILKELKNVSYIVKKVEKKERLRNPNPPFITSTLQQDAYRRLGFSARKTMRVAQQLYEGVKVSGEGHVGLITYLRTDSTRISQTALQAAKEYIESEFGKEYHPGKPRPYKGKKSAQDAHEAIRPTRFDLSPSKMQDALEKDQLRLYKLIWNRFIASQMTPAKFDTISADISAGKMEFRARGSQLKFAGFLTLYKDDQDKDELLPELKKGEELDLKELKPNQHFTQPPPRYSEASLVKTLEKEGVGRPSTYASIIENIQSKTYVVQEEKKLYPTQLGKIVVEQLEEFFPNIVDVDFTAKVEEGLDRIEEGDKDWQEFLKEFYEPFEKQLNKAEEEMKKIEIEEEKTDVECDKCGSYMVVKHGRYGKFLACPSFPDCKNTKPFVKELDVTCPKCQGKVVERKSKKGRKFLGCDNYPDCDFLTWYKPIENESCPKCNSFLVQRGRKNKYYQCSHPDCDYTIDEVLDENSKEKNSSKNTKN